VQFLVDARLIALFFKGLKISDVGENGVMGSIPIKATIASATTRTASRSAW
jgi:hypothetical protein